MSRSVKRPRSYAEDLDDDDWPRRDPDPDRTPAHHHRRHSSYSSSKPPPDSSRKGGAAPPPSDDDRDPPVRRKRCYDYEPDGFDRRKPSGGFDRYPDSGAVSSSSTPSPRGLHGGDRMYHRSESFSVLRRNFPKGFRSERDRSRRDGGGGLSWRRSSSLKENSSSRTQSAKMERPRTESFNKESSSDHEMEEGELEPDLEPERQQLEPVVEPSADAKTSSVGVETDNCEARDLKSNLMSETKTGTKENLLSKKLVSDGGTGTETDGKIEADSAHKAVISVQTVQDSHQENCEARNLKSNLMSETKTGTKENLLSKKLVSDGRTGTETDGENEADSAHMAVISVQTAQDSHQDADKEANKKTLVAGEEVQASVTDEMDAKLCSEKQELAQEDDNSSSFPCQSQGFNDNTSSSMPCQSHELKDNEAGQEAIEGQEKVSLAAPLLKEKDPEHGLVGARVAEDKPETMQGEELREEPGTSREVEQKVIDMESEPDGLTEYSQSKRVDSENNCEGVTLKLMTDKNKEDYKDKGKSLAISVSGVGDYVEHGDSFEGPSRRGFELFSGSSYRGNDKTQLGGVLESKHKLENLRMETLDLSLSLPGASGGHPPKRVKHKADSPSRATSIQSLPSSFRTSSDGFATSISFSGSQPFLHNPSCSLTQNSLDNYENSVGSHPVFQGMDHLSNGSIWQAHNSNETKPKIAPHIFNKTLLNGGTSQLSSNNLNSQHQSMPNGIIGQSSLSRQLSPTCSQGSHDSRSQQSKDKRLLARERSSSSLFRSENRNADQLSVNSAGVTEKILSKIVMEPLHLNGRMLQNMTENSIVYLKETISEMLMDTDKSRQIRVFQDALQGRSDMTMDMLAKCPKVLLEILVALKTGLPIYIQRANNIPLSELVEIFLNLRCRNLSCRNVLPVDDCDCKACIQKTGFCSACMCLVCSEFDNASNTCSWVGCDVCLHWCHTNCGLKDSHIKNGRNASGDQGTNEMQFHCIACNHPSELFGFVKEVFKTCVKDWKSETLAKELQFVRRIFSLSNDSRGKRLCNVAEQMLVKLENKANSSEVVGYIMAFLSDSGSISNPSVFPAKKSTQSDGPSKDVTWLQLQSLPSEGDSLLDNSGPFSSTDDHRQMLKKSKDVELQFIMEKKPAVVDDELESVVKLKQAEASMYQERADAARREAEGLERIAKSKNDKIEQDHGSRIARLRLGEAEERRRQKLEELHAIEKAHREYFDMKVRMEADIKELLVKMEATRRNFST